MRNLKKVLALALATVMLLGMMAMASAADFTDKADITADHVAAADVMKAIGVFTGSKGNLNPKNTLTRAEAAKVITYMLLGKANADKLGTLEKPFEDVEADNWAAGSIAYAKNLGIVSGSAGNYRPGDPLTGYEFAKMLLTAAGYNADYEGFKGAGWSNAVDAAALAAGLKAHLTIDMGANILREQAVQMAFNALEVTCVGYTGGTVIESGDTKITVGGSRYNETNNTTTYVLGAEADGKMQFAEKYFAGLKVDTAAENKFGYAVKTWKFNGKDVADEANYTVLASWDGTAASVTTGALYNIAGAVTTDVYANGADAYAGGLVVAKGGTAKPFAGYAGSLVEYVNNNGTKEVLVTRGQLAKVTKVIDATASADRKIEVNVAKPFTTAKSYEITTNAYAKGDYIMIYVVAGAVAKHEATDSVYGTLTQNVKDKDGNVTTMYIDGVAIPVAGAENYDAATEKTLNKKYTVVMNNGYAVATFADAPAAATMDNIVYIVKGGELKGDYNTIGSGKYQVEVIKMDGTKTTMKVEASEFAAAAAPAPAGQFNASVTEGLYKATDADADGEYTFAVMDDVDADMDAPVVAFGAYKTGAVEKLTTDKFETVDGKKAYWTADTKVLTISNDGKYTVSVAGVAPYANFTSGNTWVVYSETKAGSDTYEIDMVVTKGTTTVTTTDLYYAIGTSVGKVYVAAAEKSYEQYVVYSVATGEKMTVMATANPGTGFKALTKVDANNVYTFGATSGVTAKDYDETNTITFYGDYMTIANTSTPAVTDYTYATAVVVDKTTAGIESVAELDEVLDAAPYQLEYSVIVDTTANAEKVLFVIVTAYTKTAPVVA